MKFKDKRSERVKLLKVSFDDKTLELLEALKRSIEENTRVMQEQTDYTAKILEKMGINSE